MADLLVRKLLKKAGMLGTARSIKQTLLGSSNPASEFKPSDPRLMISTLKCLRWVIDQNLAEGTDFYEFGIFRGFNVWYTQALARLWGVRDMRFFGFDSFFGLPPIEEADQGGPFKEGDFSAYKDLVESNLTRFGVDWKKTFLVEGFFDQSLNAATIAKYKLRPCAFCVVDCDLYSSTVPVLDFVKDLLAPRSLVFFDDWDDFGKVQDKGEPRAFREFCEQHGSRFAIEEFDDLVALGGKGKAFIITRR